MSRVSNNSSVRPVGGVGFASVINYRNRVGSPIVLIRQFGATRLRDTIHKQSENRCFTGILDLQHLRVRKLASILAPNPPRIRSGSNPRPFTRAHETE